MSDKYGTGQDGQYCYSGSDVLINKLGLTDGDALEAAEIELTQARNLREQHAAHADAMPPRAAPARKRCYLA